MAYHNVSAFVDYYSKIRKRTLRLINCIPPDKMEWTYKEGKFTIGDMLRHLAGIERYMYGENVQNRPSIYPGCNPDLASGYYEVLNYFNRLHEESITIFSGLTEEDLQKKCTTPAGVPITTWKWLRAMVEHEVHHRGQLYTYLGMLDIPVPPLYGLTEGEVLERSKNRMEFSIIKAEKKEEYQLAYQLFQEYAQALQIDLSFQNFEKELQSIHTQYGSPKGCLLLVKAANQIVGCVGIRYFKEKIAELKRMYIQPVGRGKGIGRQLLSQAIEEAKELGYEALLLDTLPSMEKAIHLYQSFGFKEIEPYRYNPIQGTKYFRLNLTTHIFS